MEWYRGRRPLASGMAVLAIAMAFGQEGLPSVQAVRVSRAPRLDGDLSDLCWASLPSIVPFSGESLDGLAPDDSFVRLGYDDRCVYIAARSSRKGAIEVCIGGRAVRLPDAGCSHGRGNSGWDAEASIPWDQISERRPNLSLLLTRVGSDGRVIASWGRPLMAAVGSFADARGRFVGVQLIRDPRLSVLGYAYGGVEERRSVGSAGLDARYRFAPDLNGWLAINPDFANVPQGIRSIDFSYFERLPEERRPFYVEGNSYFRSPLIEVSPFMSVRLPGFDVGAKYYGKLGPSTEVGLLGIQDLRTRNDAVVTVRQSLTANDVAAVQYAGRHEDRLNNDVLAGSVQSTRGDWTLQAGMGQSQLNMRTGTTYSGAVDWRKGAWFAGAAYLSVGQQFFALDGFVPFIDEKGYSFSAGKLISVNRGAVRGLRLSVSGESYEHQDNRFYRNNALISADVLLKCRYTLFGSFLLGRFEEDDDRVATIGLRSPTFEGHGSFGVSAATGRLGGFDYSRVSPYVSWTTGRLYVSALSEIIRLNDVKTQDILWASYDLGGGRSVGGRLIQRDSDVGAYLEYRQPGYRGSVYSLILGDPNRFEFRGRAIVKVTWPF